MRHTYNSQFKLYIEGLIKQKHILGFPYLESERVLKKFDMFCLEYFPDESTFTREIGQRWAVIKSTEKPVSFQNRMAPVRELARYMSRLGINAYIIPATFTPKHAERRVPHIFTDRELKLFFTATDIMEVNNRSTIRHFIVPVIFRLMYCCGLRPAEARMLKIKDVDLSSGALNITESKGHKDRIVMMSEDVRALCVNYYIQRQHICPESEYFFPSQLEHGSPFTSEWLIKMLRLCWKNSGIREYSGNTPIPYDFRHTYVTKRLYLWMKEGKDLEGMLPYLSAYLGHERFSHTAYYIHLVPEFFPQMSQMDLNRFSELIPEVET
jgi:integrase/recombinase XerD